MIEAAKSQLDKLKKAAGELEADYDRVRIDERVNKLMKHKPVEEKSM